MDAACGGAVWRGVSAEAAGLRELGCVKRGSGKAFTLPFTIVLIDLRF
jgi:hypothetical protein